jgi:hypothetical protein
MRSDDRFLRTGPAENMQLKEHSSMRTKIVILTTVALLAASVPALAQSTNGVGAQSDRSSTAQSTDVWPGRSSTPSGY